jgi:molybdate/tungstate transport system substrate-binding protein
MRSPDSPRGRRSFLAAAATGAAAGLAGCLSTIVGDTATDELLVFHAGSLGAPFRDAARAFREETGVNVVREAKGSVASTKKVTVQGRAADVLAVADFRLLRDRVVPRFGDWYAVFATNAMALAYADHSTGLDEIGTENWWRVLSRDDVAVAHSDPATDPNGYRSVMAMRLGAVPFEGERLYDEPTARRLEANAFVGAATETDLLSQLAAGELDYAWEYASAAESHDVPVLELQPHVDLSRSTPAYADHYASATVAAGDETFVGAPIAYGVTVPSVAKRPALAARFVEFLLAARGQSIVEANGLGSVRPPVVPERLAGAVPQGVRDRVSERRELGPLAL